MRETMKRVALGILALAMAAVVTPSAMANPITGKAVVDGIDTYTMTGITFSNPGFVFTANASLMPVLHQFINLDDFTFGNALHETMFNVAEGTTDFTMTVLSAMVQPGTTSTFLNVKGTGIMTETGFDPTAYDFTLTSTTLGGVTGYGITLVPASAVPEPASLLLLGSGLLGFAVLLFRRARRPNASLPC